MELKGWKLIAMMFAIALIVAYFSNRNQIPYVNPGRTLGGAPKPPTA